LSVAVTRFAQCPIIPGELLTGRQDKSVLSPEGTGNLFGIGGTVDAVAEKYRAFWSDQVSPLHSQDSAEFRHLVAKELRALFSDHYPESVLEIGCGNGYFFDFLNFSTGSYRGVT